MAGQMGVSAHLAEGTRIDLQIRVGTGPWTDVTFVQDTANAPADNLATVTTATEQKQVELRGTATLGGVVHNIAKSFPIIDISGWAAPLNDTSLPLPDRLTKFAAGLTALDQDRSLEGYLTNLFVVDERKSDPKDTNLPKGLLPLADIAVNRSATQRIWSELPQFWPFPNRSAWDLLAFNVDLAGHAEDFEPYLDEQLQIKYRRSFCAAHDPSDMGIVYLCFDPEADCPWFTVSSRDINSPGLLRMPDESPMNTEQAIIDFVQHRVIRPMKHELHYTAKQSAPGPLVTDLGYVANVISLICLPKDDSIDVEMFVQP